MKENSKQNFRLKNKRNVYYDNMHAVFIGSHRNILQTFYENGNILGNIAKNLNSAVLARTGHCKNANTGMETVNRFSFYGF